MTDIPRKKPANCLIVGAGPGGLTAAYELMKHGIPVSVLEREKQVGGLARTIKYKDFGFDIGGHRFFTKIERVNKLWHEVLGDDFIKTPRLSRIFYRNRFFHYPLKPVNALVGLGFFNSCWIVASFARAKLLPLKNEDTFEEYIINRFGRRLYRVFFKTYTEKVWGVPCTEIRADWAAQRIKGLCLIQAVKNALFGGKKNEVKSLINEFDYPKLGPGMLWERLAEKLEEKGNQVKLNRDVLEVQHDGTKITGILHCEVGSGEDRCVLETADHYFTTMGLRPLLHKMNPLPPAEVLQAADNLRYRDFMAISLILKREKMFPDNWIYVHSPEVRVGRIQNFGNWSPYLVPVPHRTALGLEYFVFENDDLWVMKDDELIKFATMELDKLGLAKPDDVLDGFVLRVKKAYPMYDDDYAENVEVIRQYLIQFSNLDQVGRNGLHKYNNQDHSMLTALLAIDNLVYGTNHNVWDVNSDTEYHEEVKIPETEPEQASHAAV